MKSEGAKHPVLDKLNSLGDPSGSALSADCKETNWDDFSNRNAERVDTSQPPVGVKPR